MKEFYSPTMDKLNIEPCFEDRLSDLMFAQVKLRHLNARGHCLEETIQLTEEMRRYILYLYSHIHQLEKDKQELLQKYLKEKHRKEE